MVMMCSIPQPTLEANAIYAAVNAIPSFSSCDSLDESVLSVPEMSCSYSSIGSVCPEGIKVSPRRRGAGIKKKLKLTSLVLSNPAEHGAFEAKSKRQICQEYLERADAEELDQPTAPQELCIKCDSVLSLKSSILRHGSGVRKSLTFAPCVEEQLRKTSSSGRASPETWCRAPLLEEDEE